MLTKYDAHCSLIEGASGGGTTVWFYGTDEKGRLLKISVGIEKLQELVKAFNECQSTGHAAWHVEGNYPVPCSFCSDVKKSVEDFNAQVAWNEEWKRKHDENGEVIK